MIGGCTAIAFPGESIWIGSLQIGHNGHSTSLAAAGGAGSPAGAPAPIGKAVVESTSAAETPEGASTTVVGSVVVGGPVGITASFPKGSGAGSDVVSELVGITASFPEGSKAVSTEAAGPVDGIIARKTSEGTNANETGLSKLQKSYVCE